MGPPLPKPTKAGSRRVSRAKLKDVLDDLCRKAVKDRDGWRCTVCGRGPLVGVECQWAHLIARNSATRWDWEGSTTLCRGCHCYYTYRAELWVALCIRKMGEARWDALVARSRTPGGRKDMEAWRLYLLAGPNGQRPW